MSAQGQLETQVEDIRRVFTDKEARLIKDKTDAEAARKAAEDMMKHVEASFRKQLEQRTSQLHERDAQVGHRVLSLKSA